MTIMQFLALFYPIKETKKGWDVCCPAHEDQHPSLGVLEGEDGKIVLNCFAGCTPHSICEALGLTLADLFAEKPLNGVLHPIANTWKPLPPQKRAFAFELHALDLRQAAQKILDTAGRCTVCETWTDDEREYAMKLVSRAYVYLDRAAFCEDYADHLREANYVPA